MRHLGVLLILSSSVAHAQNSATTAAKTVKIDAVMKPWASTKAPGCAVAMTGFGKVTFAKGYGMADLERGVPITPETIFDIGSVSKQFTAATIHLLAAAGKLRLDDDIRTHLPQLPSLSKQPVTIRHLLHHTGGLRDYTTLLIHGGRKIADVASSRETLAALARQRGNVFEPGDKWEYSNTGYFLLAQIAERAGKQTMAGVVRDRIFKPLGMTSSQVLDDHTRLVPGRALGYAPDKTGWKLDMSQWEQTGDGAVLTTVQDLAKWDANFHDKKVGGAALITALELRGQLGTGKDLNYASGLVHELYRGLWTIGHGGAWAGYRAQLIRLPSMGASVIVLCNAANADPKAISLQIIDAIYERSLVKPTPDATPVGKAIELTTVELDAWVGAYREVASGAVVAVKRAGKALVAEAGEVVPLTATSKKAFRIGATPITIEFAGTRPKRTATLKAGGQEQKFVEITPYKPSATELAALAGRYWSNEVQAMWTIRIEGGVAIVDGPNLDAAKLDFSSATEAGSAAAELAIVLSRTPTGVTGFTLAGGLSGVRFDRL